MTKTELDAEDAALLVAGFIGITAMVGIAEWTILDLSLADVIYTFNGTDIDLAYLLSAGALVGTIATNDNTSFNTLQDDLEDLSEDWYLYAVGIAVGGLVAWLFLPQFVSLVTGNDVWALAYVAISMAAQAIVAWML